MATVGFWTDGLVEKLKKLCADPTLSAADIALRLGCSRNAALGKLHRLGLSCKAVQPNPGEIELARAARQARKNAAKRARHVPVCEPKPAKQPEPPFLGSLHLPFGSLRMFSGVDANECRFIEGDGPDYLCCGTETLPGQSYCGHHHEIPRRRSIDVSDAVRSAAAARIRRLGTFDYRGVSVPLTIRIPDPPSVEGAL